ncbi:hypothetical protein HAX54_048216 [Datura stramonium]|uniref:Uncharacterized protein n=1 Tax=Datura stramonium TaxID=4076 RepID=A0ABS8STR4_DATST|nr:hypothetical protein [Datura stramonium]
MKIWYSGGLKINSYGLSFCVLGKTWSDDVLPHSFTYGLTTVSEIVPHFQIFGLPVYQEVKEFVSKAFLRAKGQSLLGDPSCYTRNYPFSDDTTFIETPLLRVFLYEELFEPSSKHCHLFFIRLRLSF